MIRYKIKRNQLTRELELLRAVYEELEATQPVGLRYASFQLEDEVTFGSSPKPTGRDGSQS